MARGAIPEMSPRPPQGSRQRPPHRRRRRRHPQPPPPTAPTAEPQTTYDQPHRLSSQLTARRFLDLFHRARPHVTPPPTGRLYVAFAPLVAIGTAMSASIPVVGFNAVLMSEHFGAFFAFVVLHVALLVGTGGRGARGGMGRAGRGRGVVDTSPN